ncbi:MAG: glucose-1-phosphate thymidylyltransferase [Chloroflexi bacterium]|nr:glucose-1-phosphate thymidylyltransferase [Chloroflexota bacterium]
MKGLILSGGKGTRLRPITYTSAKQLVPIANKPVLFYAIENLVDAGITDLGIIVGDTKEEVKAAVGDGSHWGAKVTYIEQDQPLGLAHAIKVARGFLGDDRFVMFLGDNFIQESISPLVNRFEVDGLNCQILLTSVPNPEECGVVEIENGRVIRLVEKPKEPKSDLVAIGIYMFDHHVFDAIERIKPSWRGELEITDTIQQLIDAGLKVGHYILKGWWVDTGKMSDILEANRLLLEDMSYSIQGHVDGESKVFGKVVIEKGAEVVNSVIRGPAIIGENTIIMNSFVGPFTSIHFGCTVTNSEIEHSIVLENSQILDIEGRIEDSLIGRNVEITKSPIKPKAFKLMLGDNSKVGIL